MALYPIVILSTRIAVILKFLYVSMWYFETPFNWQTDEGQCFDKQAVTVNIKVIKWQVTGLIRTNDFISVRFRQLQQKTYFCSPIVKKSILSQRREHENDSQHQKNKITPWKRILTFNIYFPLISQIIIMQQLSYFVKRLMVPLCDSHSCEVYLEKRR